MLLSSEGVTLNLKWDLTFWRKVDEPIARLSSVCSTLLLYYMPMSSRDVLSSRERGWCCLKLAQVFLIFTTRPYLTRLSSCDGAPVSSRPESSVKPMRCTAAIVSDQPLVEPSVIPGCLRWNIWYAWLLNKLSSISAVVPFHELHARVAQPYRHLQSAPNPQTPLGSHRTSKTTLFCFLIG